jgi:hypothetical protein
MTPSRPVRIGNASAFYGDRLTSMRALVDGGQLDVITGDYLAELTMLILWKAKQKDPSLGSGGAVSVLVDSPLVKRGTRRAGTPFRGSSPTSSVKLPNPTSGCCPTR